MALRRPAAAKAALRRPGLRRPAAAEEGEIGIPPSFASGEFVEANKVPVEVLLQGSTVVVKGEYWQADCQVSGEIQGLRVKGAGDTEVLLRGEGTNHEELLKWISGNPTENLRVHLCGRTCTNKTEAPSLVHAREIRKKKADEGGWTENLKESVDELARLRREAGEAGVPPGPGAEKASEKEKERKEKRKKQKKEKKRRSTSEKSADKRPATDRKRKIQAQKDLEQVFGTTGFDPDPRVRKKVIRQLRKKLKKKKNQSESETRSSTEGSSEDSDVDSSHSEGVFEEKHKVRSVAKRAPGALTYTTLREMQKQLLTSTGAVWEMGRGSVPPVALQYFRGQLVNRLSGGVAREALTLRWALDLALQGRIAEATDCLAQRLKSIEMTAGGSSWMVSQRVEVVPPEKGQLSTRVEAQEAARETKEELKVKGMTKGKEKGKSDYGSGWRPSGKGESKGKDRPKGKKGGEREERRKDS